MTKVLLLFGGLAVTSILITAACVVNGFEPWQILAANMLAGGVLGFLSELKR